QSSRCAREYAGRAQHGRLHAVLLLSLGGARPAAALVQIGALPLARRRRSGHARQHDRHRTCPPAGGVAMNGAADMGGMHGFGPVVPEANEPVFHADWEKKAFAVNLAIGVANIWTLDAFRFARETLPPAQYLNLSYFGLWVVTTENMLLDYGVATAAELN